MLVGPRASVVYEGQSYAMPPEAVGLIGVLRLYPDRVEIAAGRYETTHPRRRPAATYTPPEIDAEHRRRRERAAPNDRPRPRPRTGFGPDPDLAVDHRGQRVARQTARSPLPAIHMREATGPDFFESCSLSQGGSW